MRPAWLKIAPVLRSRLPPVQFVGLDGGTSLFNVRRVSTFWLPAICSESVTVVETPAFGAVCVPPVQFRFATVRLPEPASVPAEMPTVGKSVAVFRLSVPPVTERLAGSKAPSTFTVAPPAQTVPGPATEED